MPDLLKHLQPADLDLKSQMVSAFFENPFLEGTVSALVPRFGAKLEEMETALADLCRCNVLQQEQGVYRFCPDLTVLEDVAALARAHQGGEATVRQEVVEREALAHLQDLLAVSQKEVAAILEIVPAGVLLLDRYGHLLKYNGMARTLVGPAVERSDGDVCGWLGLELEEVLAREVRTEVELDPPLMVVSRPFQTKGSDAGAVITVQDISEWRAVETQAEQMREAFFSMIRHELRRPLLEVERFLGGLDKEAPVDGSEALAGARRSASHLAAMVDDMLSLARLERDPLAVCLQRRVSLQFLLAGSDLAFRARAAEARLRLEVCLPEEDVVFWGDERRLSQVVGNLLDNALKFSRPGGSVELAGGLDGTKVWMAVGDSGPGIPEGERERVFGRFYQASQGADRPEGLGLGLAICRRVVEAHGGSIGVEEQPGGGARITVRLPVEAQPDGQGPAER